MKYYSLKKILTKNARYNMIFGERSNGKTYSVQEYALKKYLEDGSQLAVIRRWREDFRGKRGAQYFENLSCNGKGQNIIKELTNGLFDRIEYYASKWYLAYFDDYGIELEKFIGTGPNDGQRSSELFRYVKEGLMVNPYITDVTALQVTQEHKKITMVIHLETVYGEVEMGIEV